jgi:hypothetical protein
MDASLPDATGDRDRRLWPAAVADISARLMGQWLSERLGRQFVIENRTGAAGNIGTNAVVRAAPDGYTLLLVASPNAINATLYDKLNFNFIRDIAPVASIIRSPNVMLVHPSVPTKYNAVFNCRIWRFVHLTIRPPEADGHIESHNFARRRHQITANSPIQSALEVV